MVVIVSIFFTSSLSLWPRGSSLGISRFQEKFGRNFRMLKGYALRDLFVAYNFCSRESAPQIHNLTMTLPVGMNADQFGIHQYQCSSFHQKFFQFQVDKQQYMYNCLQDFHKSIQMDNRTRQSCIRQHLDMIHRHHLYDSLILFQNLK